MWRAREKSDAFCQGLVDEHQNRKEALETRGDRNTLIDTMCHYRNMTLKHTLMISSKARCWEDRDGCDDGVGGNVDGGGGDGDG
ncbi:hypothetical protein LINPERHAP1_LOCUS34477, partial [Linum perenne]